jgi:DNA invertase Pin-like site-specific DNA recombinase
MLTAAKTNEEPITTAHRAQLAYVYIRQSTAGQVRQHQESTQLQYRLVSRAVTLGWPRDRIEVIDDDLGKSGASSDARYGFQRLIAEIGLSKAGLVLSFDASRLARNNRDWHQLLELCSLFGVLIADGERLYDPRAYHDRLLLGLSGIMSEAELHQIQVRLHQGERQKAARGELRLPLPAGFAHGPCGAVILNPDEEVQARLRLVFSLFQQLLSAHAVRRALLCAGLPSHSGRLSGQRRIRLFGVTPRLRGSSKFSRTQLMLGRMFTEDASKTPAAGGLALGGPQRWPSRSSAGRFVSGMPSRAISAGRSSWPTRNA